MLRRRLNAGLIVALVMMKHITTQERAYPLPLWYTPGN